jgi:hypothetical protein
MLGSSQNLQNTDFSATRGHIGDHQIYEGRGFNGFDSFLTAFDCFLSNLFALYPNANRLSECMYCKFSVEISHH